MLKFGVANSSDMSSRFTPIQNTLRERFQRIKLPHSGIQISGGLYPKLINSKFLNSSKWSIAMLQFKIPYRREGFQRIKFKIYRKLQFSK